MAVSTTTSRTAQTLYRDEEKGREWTDEESSDADSMETLEIPLTKDFYGGFAASCLHWVATPPELRYNLDILGSLVQGVLIGAIGLILQMIMILLLLLFTTERASDVYEVNLDDASKLFRDAIEKNTTLPKGQAEVKLCLRDHSVPYSQSVITLLWCFKILPDISTCLWEVFIIYSLPSGKHALNGHTDNKQLKMSIMSTSEKLMAQTVLLVRLAATIATFIAGMKFLLYCESVGALILKAVTLSYILTVPGFVFAALASKFFFDRVSKTVFTAQVNPAVHWNAWMSMAVRTTVCVAITVLYCRVIHESLQNWREACFAYKNALVFPSCGDCGLEFFGQHFAN